MDSFLRHSAVEDPGHKEGNEPTVAVHGHGADRIA
jgi:hypothetical protein